MYPPVGDGSCWLVDNRGDPPVLVRVVATWDMPADRLATVEALWKPARLQLAGLVAADESPEHGHWDWGNPHKQARVRAGRLRIVGVECDGGVQGLMAIDARPWPSRLTPGREMLYVDYVETAPWNLAVAAQRPRFLRVGTALVELAVRASLALGHGGRVGLHSLPQAEGFYADRCGMTPLGPDQYHHDLVQYEYSDAAAARWLAGREGGPNP